MLIQRPKWQSGSLHGSELGLLNTRYGCVGRCSCTTPDSGTVSCLWTFLLLLFSRWVPHLSLVWEYVPCLIVTCEPGFDWYPRRNCFFSEMEKKWIWGKKRQGTTGRRGGRGNYGQDIIYERKIREIFPSHDAILKTILKGFKMHGEMWTYV